MPFAADMMRLKVIACGICGTDMHAPSNADGQALVSHCFPLARMQEALEVARHDPSAVKVVINP